MGDRKPVRSCRAPRKRATMQPRKRSGGRSGAARALLIGTCLWQLSASSLAADPVNLYPVATGLGIGQLFYGTPDGMPSDADAATQCKGYSAEKMPCRFGHVYDDAKGAVF